MEIEVLEELERVTDLRIVVANKRKAQGAAVGEPSSTEIRS